MSDSPRSMPSFLLAPSAGKAALRLSASWRKTLQHWTIGISSALALLAGLAQGQVSSGFYGAGVSGWANNSPGWANPSVGSSSGATMDLHTAGTLPVRRRVENTTPETADDWEYDSVSYQFAGSAMASSGGLSIPWQATLSAPAVHVVYERSIGNLPAGTGWEFTFPAWITRAQADANYTVVVTYTGSLSSPPVQFVPLKVLYAGEGGSSGNGVSAGATLEVRQAGVWLMGAAVSQGYVSGLVSISARPNVACTVTLHAGTSASNAFGISGSAWAVMDPIFSIDPAFPLADQFRIDLSPEVTQGGHPDAPPSIVITSPLEGLVTGVGSVSVTAQVTDDGNSTVNSSPPGMSGSLGAGTNTVSGSLPLASEGQNILTVSATDAAHPPVSYSISVYRDTVPPAVSITPEEGTIVSTPIPSFGIAVTDQTLTAISIDGNYIASAEVPGGDRYGVSTLMLTGSIDLWHEGVNTIVVAATDAAGNTTTVTRHVILDSAAPVVTITNPLNGACFGAGSPTLIPLVVSIDDANPVSLSGALTGSLPAGGGTLVGTYDLLEGVNVIAVTAQGPIQSATDTIAVTLDTIPPTVAITSPDADAWVRGTIEFHASAADVLPGAVASSAYFVDGAALPQSDLYRVDTTLMADGPHELRVDAMDTCGNTSTASITIRVDNTPPGLTISNPLDLEWISGVVGFDAAATDAGSGLVSITMLAAGAAPTTDGSQVFADPLAGASVSSQVDTAAASGGLDGDMAFAVTARDGAGNTTTVAITAHVLNTQTSRTITSPEDGAEVRCVIDLKATVVDPNLASVQFVVDGVALPAMTAPPYQTSYDTRNRLDGDMTIMLITTDLAGNAMSTAILVTVDNLEVELEPEAIELKSKGGDKSVTAKIRGQSADLLLALNPQDITLCVSGATPIPATVVHGHEAGWRCEQEHDASHRGHRKGHEHGAHGDESEVKLKFDRQRLIGALRGAGLTTGRVEITIRAAAGGQTFVIGSDLVRVKG